MSWKRVAFFVATGSMACAALWAWPKYAMWHEVVGESNGNWCIEIGPDDAESSTGYSAVDDIITWRGWRIRPGRYCHIGQVEAHVIARRIGSGERSEVNVTVPAKRTAADLAGAIAPKIWADSASLHQRLALDSVQWQIIPNTYRMYWEASADDVYRRLIVESQKWWNRDRLKTASDMGMTAREVVILASIVQEETARVDEAPRVAGLYLNRLKKGMLLQADPTLKFALGDWNIRRLLDQDKLVDSPYNTYRNPGLPPGPIRIPEAAYIDAVLQADNHPYLYMCAKPDGSGTHAFATSYAQHLRNARDYQRMLNREQIYR